MAAPSKQDQWETAIQPQLRRLRRCARMIRYYSLEALAAAEQLPVLPTWETRAQADINDAVDALIKASNMLNIKPKEEM